jgi:predicted Zn-dependent peptidase
MLDRITQPSIPAPENIYIPEPEIFSLQNGTPIYSINQGTQEVIKIELVFNAGIKSTMTPLLAHATNELIDEGTKTHTSAEIAEMLDNYGAYLQTEVANDSATVTLFTLGKFLNQTLPVLKEIILEPLFSVEEIQTFAAQGKQRMSINLGKVDYLARRNFLNSLYSNNHPLGIIANIEDFDNISQEMLISFYHENYLKGLQAVIIAGSFNLEQQNLIIETLNNINISKSNLDIKNNISIPEPSKKYIEKNDSVQSAIRIGKRLFNRHHEDYFEFTILNTVLGGYFGSRLMSNIREDKGYTYGIGSGLMTDKSDGYFYIATEVGTSVKKEAVKEIYHEIEHLCIKKIEENELMLVKNYLFGSFQRSIDGVFSLADRHKILLLNNLTTNHLHKYLETLKSVTPERLQSLAQKHLFEITLTEVIAG